MINAMTQQGRRRHHDIGSCEKILDDLVAVVDTGACRK
jgi:hypothetical protein